MRTRNSYYFNAALFCSKLTLVLICCFFIACGKQNNLRQSPPNETRIQISASAININKASAEELEKLPNIGQKTAQAIIEHREKFGRFRKTEHLLLVRGISHRRFYEIRNLVKAE
jgi:competence ComEA-like helix-hairpin-helix protein